MCRARISETAANAGRASDNSCAKSQNENNILRARRVGVYISAPRQAASSKRQKLYGLRLRWTAWCGTLRGLVAECAPPR